MGDEFHFEDFTQENYERIVAEAAGKYKFEPFGTTSAERHVLWRHDVDFSVHRALELARIEARAGVRASYFLRPRGAFYNLLEPAVLSRAREIAGLGHWIGLHFDPISPEVSSSERALSEALAVDREIVEAAVQQPVRCVSFHNPSTWGAGSVDADTIAGMTNAYGASIKGSYDYVSDSNGYWRDRRLQDVIAEDRADRLQVLTHPEWWQREVMSPRERMMRCIEGRAEHAQRSYEDPVKAEGRTLA